MKEIKWFSNFNHYLDLILLNHKVAASSKDQEELEQK